MGMGAGGNLILKEKVMETNVETVSKKKGRKARGVRRVCAVNESKGKFIVSFRGQPEVVTSPHKLL
jgi:hypothetical protein